MGGLFFIAYISPLMWGTLKKWFYILNFPVDGLSSYDDIYDYFW